MSFDFRQWSWDELWGVSFVARLQDLQNTPSPMAGSEAFVPLILVASFSWIWIRLKSPWRDPAPCYACTCTWCWQNELRESPWISSSWPGCVLSSLVSNLGSSCAAQTAAKTCHIPSVFVLFWLKVSLTLWSTRRDLFQCHFLPS